MEKNYVKTNGNYTTLREILTFMEENGLNLDSKIYVNGGEIHYIYTRNGAIYVDETEFGTNDQEGRQINYESKRT